MTKSLILAGGCFWCVEHDLREAPGVLSVTSGYSGGETENPTYENHKGHREVVLVEFDDETTSYKKLIQFFIDHIDPTDTGGQFADRGESYRTAIYYENEEEKAIAEGVLKELNDSHVYDKPSEVDVLPRKPFYKAEEYHQNYAEKNPTHYALYRAGSGRADFVNRTCQIREEKNIPWSE
jgi:peptide methionine sulfoxide reductase msrA/msrB